MSSSRKIFSASEDEILQGKVSDVYFERSIRGMNEEIKGHEVSAEFTVSGPHDPWVNFTGLEEVVSLLEGKGVDLYSVKEGTIFPLKDANGVPIPVMRIGGEYSKFGIFETSILGLICQSSGISTYSSRIRREIGTIPFYSFGIRRMHPAISPMIDRAAYIGGSAGVSGILGGELTKTVPVGTMPHAMAIIYGDDQAWKMVAPVNGGRTVLIDTFMDEKFAAIKAAETIPDLRMIRIDTPASRRGKMESIIREIRWELNLRGHGNVKIMVSGGLKLENLAGLVSSGADSFGIGTSIASARPYDFSMDIVEVDGNPVTKRGKFSGRKEAFRCESCRNWFVRPAMQEQEKCKCGGNLEPMLHQFLKGGSRVSKYPEIEEIRENSLREISFVTNAEGEKWST